MQAHLTHPPILFEINPHTNNIQVRQGRDFLIYNFQKNMVIYDKTKNFNQRLTLKAASEAIRIYILLHPEVLEAAQV